MKIVQVGFGYDHGLVDPDQLLDRYRTLTGWSEALLEAGAGHVAVVQRFRRHARVVRRGIEYMFRPSGLRIAVIEQKPDVVHVNGLDAPAGTWMLKRRLPESTPLLVQHHGGGEPPLRVSGFGAMRRAVRRRAMLAADGFIFTADAQADAWRRAGLLGSMQRVYEVIESSTLLQPVEGNAARSESGIGGTPAVLWVGRLNANKDPLTVLEGFERLVTTCADARLTMVYGEEQGVRAVVERIEASQPLKSRVRMVGRVPHNRLAAYYSAADLFVLGSHVEGSGYAAIEACACGAIPVVTDIPSFRAITGGGSIGSLWAPGDAADCSRALADAAFRVADRERARVVDHFRSRLSWSAIGRSAMVAYEDACRSRRSALGPRRSA